VVIREGRMRMRRRKMVRRRERRKT